ncbi:MAG: hypothetical protein GY847_33860 [Proteobacteria bacterium]|nr:hypothetical protein [Pseudomonadota bacterium]
MDSYSKANLDKVGYLLFFAVAFLFACATVSPSSKVDSRPPPESTPDPIDVFDVLIAGPGEGELVRKALESDEANLRVAGLLAAGRIDPEEVSLLEQVSALADDPNIGVRRMVASVLPTLRTDKNLKRVVSILEQLTRDDIVEVRVASLEAAEQMGSDAFLLLAVILEAAIDPSSIIQAAALRVSCVVANSAQRSDLALPIVLEAMENREIPVRIAATNGLGRLGQGASTAFDRLLAAADDPSPEVRAAAMTAMPRVDPPRAWPRCFSGIDDPDSRVVAVAGACLKGVHGDVVGELITRFKRGGRPMERAMAILLAGADPIAAVALSRAARSGDAESRGLLSYSLWHLSRRSGNGRMVSRWEEAGDWDQVQIRDVLDEVAVFTTRQTDLESAQRACSERWGGRLVEVDSGDEMACFDHSLGFADVGIRMAVTEIPEYDASEHKNSGPGSDLEVEYQALFALQATNELGLQVAVLQLLEDAGCRYLPDRLPEDAACSGPGGEVKVRLIPGSGVVVIKPLLLIP